MGSIWWKDWHVNYKKIRGSLAKLPEAALVDRYVAV
jgi:hypothetical protein